QLAISGGDSLIHDQNTPGGYTLEGHASNATSINKINSRNWDFVILQDQSQRPSFPPAQVAVQVYPYAKLLDSIIRANDPCTEPIFYMTWGRKYGDQSNCANYPPLCTYAGMQGRLRTSYLQMAQDNNATVAPCGVAWWESILRDSTLELYSADQSHPAYTGSYLNACVFYAAIYRKSPLGLNFHGSLDAVTATFLQNVAHDVVFDSLTQWRIGHQIVTASFSSSLSNATAQFQDNSQNATSWQWSFGDGNTDTAASPIHTYASSGQYIVQLIAGNGCMQDTLLDTLNISIVGLQAPDYLQFSLSPNPCHGTLAIEMQLSVAQTLDIKVYDLNGKILKTIQESASTGLFRNQIVLTGLNPGIYLLEIRTPKGVYSKKFILE
ncbi:MAG TPA: T9SS type A sorting domain-containing protein, partial [Bacteroidetes bacterium]|nr:T9SS type A sorting domain-containing protein [Bacteroidota bacterium]